MTSTLSEQLSIIASPACHRKAEVFANKHGLNISTCDESDSSTAGLNQISTPYALVYQPHGITLQQAGKGAPGPISASFLQGKNAHRRQFGGGKGQLIAKAVGLKAGVYPRVVDATAGLGRDAFVLASLGCEVLMIEQSPVVSELLGWALEEAADSEIAQITGRMRLLQDNALNCFQHIDPECAQVVYLDPMYPERDKSALVKKEMRAFHDLVGSGENEAELLRRAIDVAQYRVVVKRPRKGEAIDGPEPNLQLNGKSCRYDIYTKKSMAELKSKA